MDLYVRDSERGLGWRCKSEATNEAMTVAGNHLQGKCRKIVIHSPEKLKCLGLKGKSLKDIEKKEAKK